MTKAHQVAAFHLAACPRCQGLQVQENLASVKMATCRRCFKKSPPAEWSAAPPFVTADQARQALFAASDPDNPVAPSLGPVAASPRRANRKERLASLLTDLSKPSYTMAQLDEAFRAAGLASALPSLIHRGDVYAPVPGTDSWRVGPGAALHLADDQSSG